MPRFVLALRPVARGLDRAQDRLADGLRACVEKCGSDRGGAREKVLVARVVKGQCRARRFRVWARWPRAGRRAARHAAISSRALILLRARRRARDAWRPRDRSALPRRLRRSPPEVRAIPEFRSPRERRQFHPAPAEDRHPRTLRRRLARRAAPSRSTLRGARSRVASPPREMFVRQPGERRSIAATTRSPMTNARMSLPSCGIAR